MRGMKMKDDTKAKATDVTKESFELSDDEIWILRTADEEAEKQLKQLLQASEKAPSVDEKYPTCKGCSQVFPSAETLAAHRCRKRRSRKPYRDDTSILVPTKEDFIKRAQGKPRVSGDIENDDSLTVKVRKKKTARSDHQVVVTCDDCNKSFTSKVRLKFHMRFHENNTSLLTELGAYKCPQCEMVFECETALFDHVHFQHLKRKRWMCPVHGCGKTFYLRATLTKHSRTHTDTRRYVCVTCGKRFLDKQTLDEHGVTHLQIKPYQCHICLKQLTRRSRLRMHLRAHEEELTPRLVHVCAVCSAAFKDTQGAQEHAAKSPKCIEAFASELKEEEDENPVQLSPTSGLMKRRPSRAESPKLSRPIRRQVASPVARPLLAALPDEARCIIRVVEIEKAFRCEFCEDVFYLEEGLNNHRVIHKGVTNPFTCHICKVKFATYSRCTTHKTTHGFYKRPLQDSNRLTENRETGQSFTRILGYGDFPVVKHFLCEDCGRSYLHWTYLQVHRRMKHPQENFLHKCNQCEMTFPNSWSVAYHRKKFHVKPNPDDPLAANKKSKVDYRIKCRDCDAILSNKNALYTHRSKVHSDTAVLRENYQDYSAQTGLDSQDFGERSRTCHQCNMSFLHIEDFHRHAKDIHNVTASNIVGYHSLGTLSARDERFRTDAAERRFICEICGVAFKRATAMHNHRLVHTSFRAWACDRCPKRFRIRSELRAHLRLKHPTRLIVVEIDTLNPSPEYIDKILNQYNIPKDQVNDVSMMIIKKGTTNMLPNSLQNLTTLSRIVPVKKVPFRKTQGGPIGFNTVMASSRQSHQGSSVTEEDYNGERVPRIPQSAPAPQPWEANMCYYPEILPSNGDDTDLEFSSVNPLQVFHDGVLINGNEMVDLQFD